MIFVILYVENNATFGSYVDPLATPSDIIRLVKLVLLKIEDIAGVTVCCFVSFVRF